MIPKLGETIYVDFITSAADGSAADADSLPTAEVFEDAADTTVTALTVAKRTSKTGNYRVPIACTTGNAFEVDKSYNVVATAVVGGVTAKAVVARFQVRPILPDVNAAKVGGENAVPNDEIATDIADIKTKTDQFVFTTANKVDATATVSLGSNAPAGWINAAAIASDAITAAKIADGAIDTATFASGTTLPRVTLCDTISTYTGNTPQTGDSFALIGATGSGLTSLATASGQTAIKAKTDLIPSSPAAVGSVMLVDMTQTVPTSNTAQTVGDALNAARAQAFGRWVKSGTSLVLYAANGSTVVRTFTLDDADAPTSRT